MLIDECKRLCKWNLPLRHQISLRVDITFHNVFFRNILCAWIKYKNIYQNCHNTLRTGKFVFRKKNKKYLRTYLMCFIMSLFYFFSSFAHPTVMSFIVVFHVRTNLNVQKAMTDNRNTAPGHFGDAMCQNRTSACYG